jgi:hypothetical protein
MFSIRHPQLHYDEFFIVFFFSLAHFVIHYRLCRRWLIQTASLRVFRELREQTQ